MSALRAGSQTEHGCRPYCLIKRPSEWGPTAIANPPSQLLTIIIEACPSIGICKARCPAWPCHSGSRSGKDRALFPWCAILHPLPSIPCVPNSPFLGQGVQRIGMATPWVEAFPGTCRPFLEEMDARLDSPLSRIIAEGPNSALNATVNSQPAIMATSIMILRVLEQDFGFKVADRVDVTLGHSLGEFAAVVAGGYVTYPAALTLLRRRAEVMATCTHAAVEAAAAAAGRKGGAPPEDGMVAWGCEPGRRGALIATIGDFLGHNPFPAAASDLDEGDHVPAIQAVSIANENSKNQIVLSGDVERINALLVQLRQFGGHDPRAVRLNSDAPFHSPIMLPARAEMVSLMADTEVEFPGHFPCISNVTSQPMTSAAEIRDLLARQCVETVRWWGSIKYVDREMGIRRWVGVGPGKVGRNLVGKEVGMKGHDVVRGGGVWSISKPDEVEDFLKDFDQTESIEE